MSELSLPSILVLQVAPGRRTVILTLIGLVRITRNVRDVTGQHAALDPICTRIFEEHASSKRLLAHRPDLMLALRCLEPGDKLVVQKVRFLAQNMINGIEVLDELLNHGIEVKVLEGSVAGDHDIASDLLDQVREVTELRRSILTERIKTGQLAARKRGIITGRPRISEEKRRLILSLGNKGEPQRFIAQSAGVSLGTVNNVLKLKN